MQRANSDTVEPLRIDAAGAGSIAEQVFRTLRSSIVTMRLTPATALSEQDIADRLKVSRQPVREAFIKLSEIGLLRVLPQRGTFVVKISAKAVTDARFVREAVECAIARRASAGIAQAGDRGTARDHRANSARPRAPAMPKQFFVLDEAFHRGARERAECAYAWKVIEEAKAQMDRVRFLSIPDATPTERLIVQHQAILDAIAAGRGAAAERAMQRASARDPEIAAAAVARLSGHVRGRGDVMRRRRTAGKAGAMKITARQGHRHLPGPQLRHAEDRDRRGRHGIGDATLNGRELAVAAYLDGSRDPVPDRPRPAPHRGHLAVPLPRRVLAARAGDDDARSRRSTPRCGTSRARSPDLPLYQLLGGTSRDGVHGLRPRQRRRHRRDRRRGRRATSSMGYKAIRAQCGMPGLDEGLRRRRRTSCTTSRPEAALPTENVWSTRANISTTCRSCSTTLREKYRLRASSAARRPPSPDADRGRRGSARRSSRYRLFWMEDPTPAENQEAFRLIRQHTVDAARGRRGVQHDLGLQGPDRRSS